ncbi:MAG: hypothetical protein ABSA93_33280 [Streptosporangiaceae bacterium]
MAVTMVSGPANASDLLQHWCEDLVVAEIARLARRVEFAHPEQLGSVETTLNRIIEDLVLSRTKAVSGDQLATLFDLAEGP